MASFLASGGAEAKNLSTLTDGSISCSLGSDISLVVNPSKTLESIHAFFLTVRIFDRYSNARSL